MKQTAVEFYSENAMKLEIEKLKGKISTGEMLNKLSTVLIEAKKMEKKEKLERQLFIGKVCEIIGFDKTLELLKESKEQIEKNQV
jgi:hypothetical protein